MYITQSTLVYILKGVLPKDGSEYRDKVRESLEHIYEQKFEYHELEYALKRLKELNPFWFNVYLEEVNTMQDAIGSDDINDLVNFYEKISHNVYGLVEIFSIDYSRWLEKVSKIEK
jgi:hypothetical protein